MRKELKIGIFVISILVVSFFVLNYLRGEDIFNREYELVARYDNVEGLVASAPLYIKGYKAGKVTEVSYDAERGDFVVMCSVSKDFVVPVDSKMVIYSVDIMGGKGVKINMGTSSEPVADGDTLAPLFEAGLMDSLGGSIGPLLAKVTNTLDSLSVTVSGVNSLLVDVEKVGLSTTLMHLESTMANLRSLSSAVSGKSGEITSLVDNLNEFSSKLGGIAEKIDTTMSGVNDLVLTVNNSDIEGVVRSFKDLLEGINDPDGSIGKLLNNGSVYDSIDSLLKDVNLLVDKIQENPRKYLKISVF